MKTRSADHNLPDSKKQKLSTAKAKSKKAPFELLCDIINAGDSKQLRDKLSEGLLPDINTLGSDSAKGSYTLLMKAAEEGQRECVKVLLVFGALVDLPPAEDGDDEEWFYRSNAIYLATKKGHFDIVKLLLVTDPEAELNHFSYRPLYTACRQGHLEMAKLLVEHGAELQDDQDEYGTNALMEACKSGNAELVEYLISKGANVDEENKHNPHALLVACQGRHLDVMEVLLNHDADVDATKMGADSEEDTCLNIACKRGDIEMIRLLLKYGADMTVYNREGYSPFTTAYKKGNKEAINLFLEHGIDLNDNESRWCCQKGDSDEWVPMKDQLTPLMRACSKNDISMIKRLLTHGADPSVISESEDGLYEVTSAVLLALDNEEILQLLLDHGADVNITDSYGNNALLYMLSYHENNYRERDDLYTDFEPDKERLSPELTKGVRMLLEHGLDVMHKNNRGKTAFDYVVADSELETLLKEYRDRKPVLK